jgi:uncharacterized protein
MTVEVSDQLQENRYEAVVDGHLAGAAYYELTETSIIFTHTEVEPAYEGQGVGGAIARFALDDARGRGLEVVALCPFVAGWIKRHPEYADLLVADD